MERRYMYLPELWQFSKVYDEKLVLLKNAGYSMEFKRQFDVFTYKHKTIH